MPVGGLILKGIGILGTLFTVKEGYEYYTDQDKREELDDDLAAARRGLTSAYNESVEFIGDQTGYYPPSITENPDLDEDVSAAAPTTPTGTPTETPAGNLRDRAAEIVDDVGDGANEALSRVRGLKQDFNEISFALMIGGFVSTFLGNTVGSWVASAIGGDKYDKVERSLQLTSAFNNVSGGDMFGKMLEIKDRGVEAYFGNEFTFTA